MRLATSLVKANPQFLTGSWWGFIMTWMGTSRSAPAVHAAPKPPLHQSDWNTMGPSQGGWRVVPVAVVPMGGGANGRVPTAMAKFTNSLAGNLQVDQVVAWLVTVVAVPVPMAMVPMAGKFHRFLNRRRSG